MLRCFLRYCLYYSTLLPTQLYATLRLFTLTLHTLHFFLRYSTLFTLTLVTLRFFLRYYTLFTLPLTTLRFFLRYSTLFHATLGYPTLLSTLPYASLYDSTRYPLCFFLRHILLYSTLLSSVLSTYFLPFFLRRT